MKKMNYEIYCEKKAERRIVAFEEKMKSKFPEGHPDRNNYVAAVNDHLGNLHWEDLENLSFQEVFAEIDDFLR